MPSAFKECPSPDSTLAAEWQRRSAERRCHPREVVGGVSGSALERTRRTGCHFQSNGCAGRGAVPGRSRGDPQRACGFVPDGDGWRLCYEVARVVHERFRARRRWHDRGLPVADRLLVRGRSLGPRAAQRRGERCRRRRPRARTCRRHCSAAVPNWQWITSNCAGSMRRSRCFGRPWPPTSVPCSSPGRGMTKASHLVWTSRRRRHSSTPHGFRRPIFRSRARSSSTPSRFLSEKRRRT